MTSTLYSSLPQPKYSYTTTPTHTHLAPQSDHLVLYKLYNPQSHSPCPKYNININHCILAQQVEIARLNARIPPYGRRDGYIPREPEDYGDGGAFPEIHIKQYPLDMGRKNTTKSSSSVVPLKVNEKGEVQYDAILRENMRKDQIMHSKYEDLIPKEHADDELAKPSKEAEIEETEETRKALEKLINAQIETVRPTHTRLKQAEPVTVRYQAASANDNTSHASGSKQRLIKIYEMPVDPLDPPKFKHKKLPPRPPSPPVPIMHSPPRQVTVEDQKNWKIPPCVSNWKNNKGFTLPLHQRLAADGRGLYNHVINDKFAKFSEALLIAERQARKEVEARAQMRMKLSKKQKQQKEKELAAMAKKAKEAAKFNYYGAGKDDEDESEDEDERRERRDVDDYNADEARRYQEKKRKRDRDKGRRKRKRRRGRDDSSDTDSDSSSDSESDSDSSDSDDDERRKAFEEREKIRKERERERKRQYRLDKKKTGKNMSVRQRERDISEKIALGQFSGKKSTESLYDNRLFNQDSGLQAGFGADDNYNLYDKPLFQSKSRKMYRPSQLDDEIYGMDGEDILNEKSGKIRPHKGFEGAEDNRGGSRRGKAGFEFEKESSSDSDGDIEVERRDKDKDEGKDELGDELDRFTTAKERPKDKGHNKGYMFAAGGGSARNKEDYEAMESNRDKVGFVRADKDADGVNNQELKAGLYYTEEAKKEKERRDKEREDERERERSRDRDRGRDRDYHRRRDDDYRRDRRNHRRYDDERRRDRRHHHDYRDRDRERHHHSDRRRRYDDRPRDRDRDRDRRRDRSRDRESSSSESDRGRWGH